MERFAQYTGDNVKESGEGNKQAIKDNIAEGEKEGLHIILLYICLKLSGLERKDVFLQ